MYGPTPQFALGLAIAAAVSGCATAPDKPTTPAPRARAAAQNDANAALGRSRLTLDGIPKLPSAVRERMSQYLNARFTRFADFEDKGGGIVVRTRFGNIVQVHRVKRPMGAREQLTFFAEPVRNAAFVPGSYDGSLLLSFDKTGRESDQLYRHNLIDGRTVALTAPKEKVAGFVSAASGALAYASNKRNGRDFDIYVASQAEPDQAKRVLEGKGLWLPLDFSGDGARLLVLHFVTVNESSVHVLDIASGKATLVAGATHDGDAKGTIAYRAARFARHGKGVYLTSDRDGELVQLYYADLAAKTFTPLSQGVPWNVTALALSPAGRHLAFVTNEEGLSKLRLLDTRTKKTQAVGLPDGIVDDLTFSRTGAVLGFTLHQPTAPGDAYTYRVAKGKLVRWTRGEVGGLTTDFFVKPKLIRYPTFDEDAGAVRMIPAFYYKPPGAGPHPVVVHLHDGPASQHRPYFSPLFQYWLGELGVAVIAPNVRGSDGYGKSYLELDDVKKRDGAVRDVGRVLDWIGTRKDLDKSQVLLHGRGYGGYLVLASLVRFGKRVLAGVDWSGVGDFVTYLKNTEPYRRDLARSEYGDEREAGIRRFLQTISPLRQADLIRSPVFVIRGGTDPRTPPTDAKKLVDLVRGAGQKAWYFVAHDERGGFRKKSNRDLVDMLTGLFLDRMRKKRGAK